MTTPPDQSMGTATGAVAADMAPPIRMPGPKTSASPLSRLLDRAPLVGRTPELTYLIEHYEAAAAGQGGQLTFVSGEPGAGKTRLA